LVSDYRRSSFAIYASRPDAKALAIAPDGFGLADGQPDTESAKREALRLCAISAKRVCRLYAVGMDVVWSKEFLPAPAPRDVRTQPLDVRLVAEEMPFFDAGRRRSIEQGFVNGRDHKALAMISSYVWFTTGTATRGEAIRLAVENCSILVLRPCLLFSVDGFLTVQIPKSRRVTGIFLPSSEMEIPAPNRERIAEVYRGAEWRALARGRNGSWHPVAAAPSEDAAIEAALRSCSQADSECQLYAVGNFR